MRTQVQSLASLSELRIQHCYELQCGQRRGSDPVLLWLWCRPAAAAPIQPLAWKHPYATGVDLKGRKKKRKELNTVGEFGLRA